MQRSIIKKIDEEGLCLGCGLCEAVLGNENCSMKLDDDGFFHPRFIYRNKKAEKIIKKICPSLNIINNERLNKKERIWGKIVGLYEGHSTNVEVRKKSSSGGLVSAIAIHLLETGTVNAVLHVGGNINNYENNGLKISRNKEDVLLNSSSRYAPALIFDQIFVILNASSEKFCFVGKPCDIGALKNFLGVYPQYQNRFVLMVSIICAGMPSFNGTAQIIDSFHPQKPISKLVYRGNGWPGFFSFTDKNQNIYNKSYNDSWGKVLNKHLAFRCKICPEGIGMLADIAIGDAWETNNGYPDFSEKEGNSLIISRTNKGEKIINELFAKNVIVLKPLNINRLHLIQPYQYKRRRFAGVRILAATIAKQFSFNFKNLSIYLNLRNNSPKILIKEFYGTFKRALK